MVSPWADIDVERMVCARCEQAGHGLGRVAVVLNSYAVGNLDNAACFFFLCGPYGSFGDCGLVQWRKKASTIESDAWRDGEQHKFRLAADIFNRGKAPASSVAALVAVIAERKEMPFWHGDRSELLVIKEGSDGVGRSVR